MNSPTYVFHFCRTCSMIFKNATTMFLANGTTVCPEHGEYNVYTDLAVTCKPCAEEKKVCQKCGRDMSGEEAEKAEEVAG